MNLKKPAVVTHNKQQNSFLNRNELDLRLGQLQKVVTGIKEHNQMPENFLEEIDEHLKDISSTINALVQYHSFELDIALQLRKQALRNQQINSDSDYPVRVLKEHARII